MDGDYSNRAALEDFIGYKLRQRGLAQRLALPPSPPLPLNPLHLAMREAGDEFEARFTSTFSRLSSQLHVTPTLVHQRLAQVSAELFTGDTNWGRLVAFFAFGAALCEECVDKEMPTLVSQVIAWMANYLDHNLQDWIQRNGGWGKFVLL
uniref:bcl-2-like protein 2 n=1 Tax=Pristiophorus japonicus TaxID=55135 RepID=UPI00398F6347